MREIKDASVKFMNQRIKQLEKEFNRLEKEYRDRKYQGATAAELQRILSKQRNITIKYDEYSKLIDKSS